MDIQKNIPERRKDKRFKLKSSAFAIMNNSPKRVGKITDISKSGLAVRYYKNGESFNDLKVLDIFRSDFSFHIDDIKAKTISDVEIIDKTLIGSKEVRRCGIQFDDLSNNQIFQLANFIQNSSSAEGLN